MLINSMHIGGVNIRASEQNKGISTATVMGKYI